MKITNFRKDEVITPSPRYGFVYDGSDEQVKLLTDVYSECGDKDENETLVLDDTTKVLTKVYTSTSGRINRSENILIGDNIFFYVYRSYWEGGKKLENPLVTIRWEACPPKSSDSKVSDPEDINVVKNALLKINSNLEFEA